MDYLSIEGVRPYDGRYEFDLRSATFSVREWGWIKRYSGYLPLTIDDGLAGSDAELMAVFALIALARARRISPDEIAEAWDRFADAPGVVSVRLELNREEVAEEALPPSPPRSSGENGRSSGADSEMNSERSASSPSDSGTPVSASSGSRQGT